MPKYTVKDKESGKTITFNWSGEEPPTDVDMEEVFAASKEFKEPEQPAMKDPGFIGTMSPELPEEAPYSLEDTEAYVRPILEYGGMTAGGVVGSGAGPAGTIGGAGLGYGIGKKTADMMYEEQGTVGQELLGSAVDVSQGAAMEMGGAALGKLVSQVGKPKATMLYNHIKSQIAKSIRPSVSTQRTANQAKQYYKRATDAVVNIIANKDSLKLTDEVGKVVPGLPKSLKQFSEAIGQTKQIIFKQYDKLAKTATGEGARVELGSAVNELSSVLKSKPFQDMAPGTAKYIEQRIEKLVSRNLPTIKYAEQHGVGKIPIGETPGGYTTSEAQEAIMYLNKSLEAYYKNPSYDTATKAYVDSLIANHLRKNLDHTITQITGEAYQGLKNAYGALTHIERDVARRTAVDSRKNIKGLIDFSDIFSGAEIVHGIVTMNPGWVAKGVTAKMIATLYRSLNNPNRMVKNMFNKSEMILAGSNVTSSATGRAIGRTAAYGATINN